MSNASDIADRVRAATVIVATGAPPDGKEEGTGFFVAPGVAVTCAHVLVHCLADPWLWVRDRTTNTMQGHKITSHVMAPTATAAATQGSTFPEAAVVEVDHRDHPVVPLATAAVGDDVWCYGITRARVGGSARPEWDARRPKITNVEPGAFLQMAGGHILPGMSGGPVLDLAQFGVVGVTQSAAPGTDSYYAVPIDDALSLSGRNLRKENSDLDQMSIDALRRDQVFLGGVPASLVPDVATVIDSLLVYLDQKYSLVPPPLPERAVAEWVTRQLFRLNMPQLVSAIRNVIGDTFRDKAKKLFTFVGPCVPTRLNEIDSHWVLADSADDLRAELASEQPRIVHLGTDSAITAKALLQRALGEPVNPMPCTGAIGATSLGGMPEHQYDDFIASLAEDIAVTTDEWKLAPQARAADARTNGTIVAVDAGPTPDVGWLQALTGAFPGLRMVVVGRELEVPPGAEALVHHVVPPVNRDNERSARTNINALNTSLNELRIAPFDLAGMA